MRLTKMALDVNLIKKQGKNLLLDNAVMKFKLGSAQLITCLQDPQNEQMAMELYHCCCILQAAQEKGTHVEGLYLQDVAKVLQMPAHGMHHHRAQLPRVFSSVGSLCVCTLVLSSLCILIFATDQQPRTPRSSPPAAWSPAVAAMQFGSRTAVTTSTWSTRRSTWMMSSTWSSQSLRTTTAHPR